MSRRINHPITQTIQTTHRRLVGLVRPQELVEREDELRRLVLRLEDCDLALLHERVRRVLGQDVVVDRFGLGELAALLLRVVCALAPEEPRAIEKSLREREDVRAPCLRDARRASSWETASSAPAARERAHRSVTRASSSRRRRRMARRTFKQSCIGVCGDRQERE